MSYFTCADTRPQGAPEQVAQYKTNNCFECHRVFGYVNGEQLRWQLIYILSQMWTEAQIIKE